MSTSGAAAAASRLPLAERWARIRLAVFDVDGVLTDGSLQLSGSGRRTAGSVATEAKPFHVLDGHGIKQLTRAGIEVAWISGRECAAVRERARELGVERLHQGVADKLPLLCSIVAELGLSTTAPFAQVLCMGDDLADLPLMRNCAIAVTVPHAPAPVKLAADLVLRAPGGRGAVREACDRLLHGCGRHDLL